MHDEEVGIDWDAFRIRAEMRGRRNVEDDRQLGELWEIGCEVRIAMAPTHQLC